MYIYELKEWPKFEWNQQKILNKLISVRHQQGLLIGGMQSIGFQLREETILDSLTDDVVKSSEIEGEILDQSLVRSSVARYLGIQSAAASVVDRNIEGVVEMMLDATQKYDQPLTQARLFRWHRNLFPLGRSGFSKITVGEWRKTTVQVISGSNGKEKIHFEAPPQENVEHEMAQFLNWFNDETELDLVLKAAISHLWFLTIHPFEDGNGRIGRAILDLLLARSEASSHRFYSLSAQIQKERKEYYSILEVSQKDGLDISVWINWLLSCLGRAIEGARSSFGFILRKKLFWEALDQAIINERQRKVLNLLLDEFEGNLTTMKWAKIAKCSQDTAYRDILNLLDQGILKKNPEGGRSASYSLSATF
ncbi:MAG: Fic family protein [Parachlamydiaceae bacterium]|nr:Fic family protein [Parachlamydiaceae bacterium]